MSDRRRDRVTIATSLRDDAPPLSDLQRASFVKLFKYFDKSNSGKLYKDAIGEFVAMNFYKDSQEKLDPRLIEDAFVCMDLNRDGVVDENEFLETMRRLGCAKWTQERLNEILNPVLVTSESKSDTIQRLKNKLKILKDSYRKVEAENTELQKKVNGLEYERSSSVGYQSIKSKEPSSRLSCNSSDKHVSPEVSSLITQLSAVLSNLHVMQVFILYNAECLKRKVKVDMNETLQHWFGCVDASFTFGALFVFDNVIVFESLSEIQKYSVSVARNGQPPVVTINDKDDSKPYVGLVVPLDVIVSINRMNTSGISLMTHTTEVLVFSGFRDRDKVFDVLRKTTQHDVVCENERWHPTKLWIKPYLPTDRHQFTDFNGNLKLMEQVRVPNANWAFVDDWHVDLLRDCFFDTDENGYQYALDFKKKWHPKSFAMGMVRRRFWIRSRVRQIPSS